MEEALKKAMEQKEEVRVRGDALQQIVEDAVRKALEGTQKAGEGSSPHAFPNVSEPYPERKISVDEVYPKGGGHTLLWHQGVNSIAINVKMKMGEGKKGTVLFTSSVFGEGTTTICSNVARALAKIHSGNVLLLDCNVQAPEIHKLFRTEVSPGLTDILLGKINWEEAIRKSNLKNFFILTCGQSIQEPLSLLSSERMEGLLTVLKTDFDFVVLDTPPVLMSAEAEMIVSKVDVSVLVIKAQATRREVVMRAVERMIQYKEFMGAVFNQQEFIIPQFLYKRLK